MWLEKIEQPIVCLSLAEKERELEFGIIFSR